jgi:hypothetical protein
LVDCRQLGLLICPRQPSIGARPTEAAVNAARTIDREEFANASMLMSPSAENNVGRCEPVDNGAVLRRSSPGAIATDY